MKRQFCISAVVFLCAGMAHAQANEPSIDEEAARAVEAALDNAADTVFDASGYKWHASENGMSVQFGVPETDDRAFRMDCEKGQLSIIAPASTNAPDGTPTTAIFQNGERRAGIIAYLGDGPSFVVSVKPTDPVVGTLLTEGRIHIETSESVVSVAGADGIALLRTLVDRCGNQQP